MKNYFHGAGIALLALLLCKPALHAQSDFEPYFSNIFYPDTIREVTHLDNLDQLGNVEIIKKWKNPDATIYRIGDSYNIAYKEKNGYAMWQIGWVPVSAGQSLVIAKEPEKVKLGSKKVWLFAFKTIGPLAELYSQVEDSSYTEFTDVQAWDLDNHARLFSTATDATTTIWKNPALVQDCYNMVYEKFREYNQELVDSVFNSVFPPGYDFTRRTVNMAYVYNASLSIKGDVIEITVNKNSCKGGACPESIEHAAGKKIVYRRDKSTSAWVMENENK